MIVCHSISRDQPAYRRLSKEFNGPVSFHTLPEGPEEEEELINDLKKGQDRHQTALVFDDLLEESLGGKQGRFVSKMFTSSRHMNTSVLQLLQAFMHRRSNRLNTDYIVAFGMPADQGAVSAIGRQISPLDSGRHIVQCYQEATAKPHGHMILDLKSSDPLLRLRNNRFDEVFEPLKNKDSVKEEA